MKSIDEGKERWFVFNLICSASLTLNASLIFGMEGWRYTAFFALHLVLASWLREVFWRPELQTLAKDFEVYSESPPTLFVFGEASKDKMSLLQRMDVLYDTFADPKYIWGPAVAGVWFCVCKYLFIYEYHQSFSIAYIMFGIMCVAIMMSFHKNSLLVVMALNALLSFALLIKMGPEFYLVQAVNLFFILAALSIFATSGFRAQSRFQYPISVFSQTLLISLISFMAYRVLDRQDQGAKGINDRPTLKQKVSRRTAELAAKLVPESLSQPSASQSGGEPESGQDSQSKQRSHGATEAKSSSADANQRAGFEAKGSQPSGADGGSDRLETKPSIDPEVRKRLEQNILANSQRLQSRMEQQAGVSGGLGKDPEPVGVSRRRAEKERNLLRELKEQDDLAMYEAFQAAQEQVLKQQSIVPQDLQQLEQQYTELSRQLQNQVENQNLTSQQADMAKLQMEQQKKIEKLEKIASKLKKDQGTNHKKIIKKLERKIDRLKKEKSLQARRKAPSDLRKQLNSNSALSSQTNMAQNSNSNMGTQRVSPAGGYGPDEMPNQIGRNGIDPRNGWPEVNVKQNGVVGGTATTASKVGAGGPQSLSPNVGNTKVNNGSSLRERGGREGQALGDASERFGSGSEKNGSGKNQAANKGLQGQEGPGSKSASGESIKGGKSKTGESLATQEAGNPDLANTESSQTPLASGKKSKEALRKEKLKKRIESIQKKVDSFFDLLGTFIKILAIMLVSYILYQVYQFSRSEPVEEITKEPEELSPDEKRQLKLEYAAAFAREMSPEQEVVETYQFFLKTMDLINRPKENWRPAMSFQKELELQSFTLSPCSSVITRAYCDIQYGGIQIQPADLTGLRQARDQFLKEVS